MNLGLPLIVTNLLEFALLYGCPFTTNSILSLILSPYKFIVTTQD